MALKALMTQSTGGAGVEGGNVGQTCALHDCVCMLDAASGQALPPFAAAVTTVRTSCCTPPPQVSEHEPTGVKALMTQSTGGGKVGAVVGQAWVLQATVRELSAMAGHALPPCAAAVTTDRTDCCQPPPQVAEHIPTGAKSLTTQSTGAGGGRVGVVVGAGVGQTWVLHAIDLELSAGVGQANPPFAAGDMTVRTYNCQPPPHVAEHGPDDWNSLMTQSTLVVHACKLQGSVFMLVTASGQATPPNAAALTTVRTIC